MSHIVSNQPKLQTRGIEKTFRWKDKGGGSSSHQALGGIDLDIAEGRFVSVIGPSGCGKTTLLRIVASLTKQDAGSVLVDGKEATEPSHERAMVFQQFGLFPWKSVLDNVKFAFIARDVPDDEATQRAMAQLRRVGLEHAANVHPHQLSGGMQQRVGLARALAADPEILLMDEPFGAIDAQTREYMQEELMKIWDETHKTVLFITHDLDEAVLLSDEIIVLTRGPASTVRAVIEVDLPRPRWNYDVRAHKNFAGIRNEIWQLLRDDLRHQQAQELGASR